MSRIKTGRPRKDKKTDMLLKLELEIQRMETLKANSFQAKTNDLTEDDFMQSPFRARFTDFVSKNSVLR